MAASAAVGHVGWSHATQANAAGAASHMQIALSAFGVLATVLAVASPLHVPLRRALQPLLTAVVQRQLPWVAAVQRANHWALDFPVKVSALTVTVEFYVSALPILVWLGYPGLVLRLLCVLALSGFLCFAAKDLLASPRPGEVLQAPESKVPIRIREVSGDVEDGAPSAHCALSVPIMLHGIELAVAAGLLPSGQTIGDPAAAAAAAGGASASLPVAACLAWVAWIAWGRLYLGVHSPLDLGMGALLGFSVLALWQLVDDVFFAWLATGSASTPALLLLVSFMLLRLYPAAERFTHCYQHTTAWTGAWAGGVLAAWHQRAAVLVGAAAPMQPEGWAEAAAAMGGGGALLAAKLLLGLVLVVVTKVGVRAAALAVLPPVMGRAPGWLRRLWRPPIAAAAAAGAAAGVGVSSKVGKPGSPGGTRVRGCTSDDAGCSDAAVGCRPDGLAWDVDTLARFLSYCCTVAAVFFWNAWWDMVRSSGMPKRMEL